MAYTFSGPAYYGDMKPQLVIRPESGKKGNYVSVDGIKNAVGPFVGKTPTTLNETISIVKGVVRRLDNIS